MLKIHLLTGVLSLLLNLGQKGLFFKNLKLNFVRKKPNEERWNKTHMIKF